MIVFLTKSNQKSYRLYVASFTLNDLILSGHVSQYLEAVLRTLLTPSHSAFL